LTPLPVGRRLDGFLSDDHLCDSFSFFIEEANKNSEVKKYLAEYPNFFGGIRNLLPAIKNSKSAYCGLHHGATELNSLHP